MSYKPGSLRLADELIAPVGMQSTYGVMRQAATELRRQNAEIESLKAERDALLLTLRRAEEVVELSGLNAGFIRAAIERHEREAGK